MYSLALAIVLASLPQVRPGPQEVVEQGPEAPASPRAAGPWLRAHLNLRADTHWEGRRIDLAHGGWLLLLREHYAGLPVAGSRLALRVGPDGHLRQVVGRALSTTLVTDDVAGSGAQLWWPTKTGLVPARVERSPLRWPGGTPEERMRWVDVRTGDVLAEESTIEEIVVPIRGWRENSLLTPELEDYDVALADFEAILLENEVFRVYQCNWDDQAKACAPIFAPTAAEPGELYLDPPAYDDAAGNAAQDDPHAALQFMQFASRFQAKLLEWGWDPYAWDELDCSWQDTDDPADCRVEVYVNVLAQDEQGVFPFAGAFYRAKGQIFMGQGENADTSFDGDIVIHEIGHHVTHSFGAPEATGMVDDGARLYTDINAINESSSDVFAWMMGTNDRIYDYYSELEPGTYVGPRIRDVSYPFRCPENVVGEVHMDGRIWVSAVIDALEVLEDAGLADRDAYAAMYLGALGPIRHIPRDQLVQLADAREILLDEVALSFGDTARALVEDIFDERSIGTCEYVIDLREEPSMGGEPDPEDVLDARFMVFRSHKTWESPEVFEEQPYAPPVQHRITLGPDEGGVRLRYRSNLWRPPRPVDEVPLLLAALVVEGGQMVGFSRDPDTGVVTNDAQLEFRSQSQGEEAELVIDGLSPGETYTIALVSMTPVDGDKLMLEDMRWETLPAPEGGDDGGTGETGDGGTGGDTGDTGGTGGADEAGVDAGADGCGCANDEPSGAPGGLLALAALALRRRRG